MAVPEDLSAPGIAPRRAADTGLEACAREPIHIPGAIQPLGALIALDPATLRIEHASANLKDVLGHSGASLHELLGDEATDIEARIQDPNLRNSPLLLKSVHSPNGECFYVIAHRTASNIIVEFEPATPGLAAYDLYAPVRAYLAEARHELTLTELADLAAHHVRQITGFDRVLIYQFDPDWNGHVIAESRDPEVASYLDLWFPASDIPEQARRLYRLNRLRLIADADYKAVPIAPTVNPRTGQPLDLSFAFLRSVSPIHLEYLRNMGVASSMSMSLLTDENRLWGLIACHHRSPRFIPFYVRSTCDLLSQVVSNQIQLTQRRAEYERRLALRSTTTRLLAAMAERADFLRGLLDSSEEFLSFASATGAAVVFRGECIRIGDCPSENAIWSLVDWLLTQGREDVFHTECSSEIFPAFANHKANASGILALSISALHRSYVIWFRPELVATVKWGGNPRHAAEKSGRDERISPRKSFETWKEHILGRSAPWRPGELEAASELRNAIIGLVLRNAEELAQLTEELQRSNRELEAFSYTVSHDLRAPFRHVVGFAELLKQNASEKLTERDVRYIDTIIQSANFAGTLVDNLLSYSQVGRAKLRVQDVNAKELVEEVIRDLQPETAGRNIQWIVGDLPTVTVDLVMFRLVWQNLLQNAVKYTREKEIATIKIICGLEGDSHVFRVTDNGVGFDQTYAGKLFGVFQRLHRMEDYEGTGIGLANVRRIVSRHRGRTWAEGHPGAGATFYFSIPVESPTYLNDAESA